MSDATAGPADTPVYWSINIGDGDEGGARRRNWVDCRRYRYISAGGHPDYQADIQRPQPGDKCFAYGNGAGYVGFGKVLANAVPMRAFTPPGSGNRLVELPNLIDLNPAYLDSDSQCEWCLAIDWFTTVQRDRGVHRELVKRGTVNRLRDEDVTLLVAAFAQLPWD